MAEMDIENLVKKASKGDLDSYETLVRRYQETLSSFIQAQGANATEADDIAQQTFLEAYKGLKKLKDPKVFASWLFGIGRNLFFKSLKNPLDKEELARSQRTQDTQVIQARNVALTEIQRVILSLSEPYRELLLLRYYQGYSAKQMASKLSRPIGTITKQLSRAHQQVENGVRGIEGHTTTLGFWIRRGGEEE